MSSYQGLQTLEWSGINSIRPAELEARGIHSIGRYGRWEHTSMEDAIAQGRQLAEKLRAA